MMPKTTPLTIAVIGLADLVDKVDYRYDPMLYHAFMLMSLNLQQATYQTDAFGFDYTSPLEFSFTDRSLIFCKHPTRPDIVSLIQEHLLPASDGVIVNLGPKGINSDDPLQSLLREIIHAIYESKRPTVFTEKSWAFVDREWTPELAENILQPLPAIVQSIKEIFPATVPILNYHYGKPGSIQNILTTLLAEIEKGQNF